MSQTVLVADDSQTIRKIVEMALKGSTYQVIGVGSAQDAMDAARQAPSVILLDYYMPDGSGYEVCRALKNNPGTREIPVIMLGGNYKQFDENLARQSGADGIVMKPFKTDALLNAIEAVRAGASAPPAQPVQAFQQPAPPQPTYQQPPTPAPYTPPVQQPAYQPPTPAPYTPPVQQPSYQQPPTPAPYTPPVQQPSYQQAPTPAPYTPPVQQPTPAPAFQQPSYQQSPTPAPTPMQGFQQSPSPAPVSAFQQASSPFKDASPAEPPVLSMDSDPSEVDERPAPMPTPTPFPPQANAGSQPRITTPDVNASSRQPVAQASAPAPTSGSGSMNVGLSRSEIEKMIREEVRSVVKQELPGMLRTVMGETFQTKVLPRLVQHTDERIEKIVTERIASAIRDNVRVELEKLLSEE